MQQFPCDTELKTLPAVIHDAVGSTGEGDSCGAVDEVLVFTEHLLEQDSLLTLCRGGSHHLGGHSVHSSIRWHHGSINWHHTRTNWHHGGIRWHHGRASWHHGGINWHHCAWWPCCTVACAVTFDRQRWEHAHGMGKFATAKKIQTCKVCQRVLLWHISFNQMNTEKWKL